MSGNSLESRIKESQKPKAKNKKPENSKKPLPVFLFAIFLLAVMLAGRVDILDAEGGLRNLFNFERLRASMPTLTAIEEHNGGGTDSSRERLRERFSTTRASAEYKESSSETYDIQSFRASVAHAGRAVQDAVAEDTDNFSENIAEERNAYIPPHNRRGANTAPTPPSYKVVDILQGNVILLENGNKVRYAGVGLQGDEFDYIDEGCVKESALMFNKENVLGKRVSIEKADGGNIDSDGNLIRYVWLDGMLLNKKIVQYGHAFASHNGHRFFYEFHRLQTAAANDGQRIWKDCLIEEGVDINEELVINEVKLHSNEFVEIYNPTDVKTSLEGYYFAYYTSARTEWNDPWRYKKFPADSVIEPGGYFLVVLENKDKFEHYDWNPYDNGILNTSDGAVAIWAGSAGEDGSVKIDALGWGDAHLYLGTPFTADIVEGSSIARKYGQEDTRNNSVDFYKTLKPTPGHKNHIKKPENEVIDPCEEKKVCIQVFHNERDEKYIKLKNKLDEEYLLGGHFLHYYSKSRKSLDNPLFSWEFPEDAKVLPGEIYIINAQLYSGGDEDWTLLNSSGEPYTNASWHPFGVNNGALVVAPFDLRDEEDGYETKDPLVDYRTWGNINLSF